MGNLRAAALACGVVASCLGGGFGIAYATSNEVSSFDITENNVVVDTTEAVVTTNVSKASSSVSTNKTTTAKNVTTTSSSKAEKMTSANVNNTARVLSSADSTENKSNGLSVTTTQAATSAVVTTKIQVAAAPPVVTEAPTEAPTQAPVVTTVYVAPVVTEAPTTYVVTTTAVPEVTTTYVEVTTEAPAEVPVDNTTTNTLPITDEEFIILCNAVGHEAGCSWISEYDKAKVVEVIMNRVNSPLYPNTIYGVLTQPYQFSGSSSYVNLGTYSSHVTESVKAAVKLYFDEPESFTEGYFGFYGDGVRNYFY